VLVVDRAQASHAGALGGGGIVWGWQVVELDGGHGVPPVDLVLAGPATEPGGWAPTATRRTARRVNRQRDATIVELPSLLQNAKPRPKQDTRAALPAPT
jgi:hypothetical protein